MSILRKTTRRGYTHISNELLEDSRLSYRARGIASFLLSKPDDWEIKIEYLMRVGVEGEKAIRTALHELAQYGYLMRARVREGDHIRTVTYIADYPAYLETGSVEQRINGYDVSDIPVSDTSGSSSSRNRQVSNGEVLVNTDKGTTVHSKRRRNYSEPPTASQRRGSYHPEDYDDI